MSKKAYESRMMKVSRMHSNQGMSVEQIARALGIARKTVNNYINEIRRYGKACLHEYASPSAWCSPEVDTAIIAGEEAGQTRREICDTLGWEPTERNMERIRYRRKRLGFKPRSAETAAKPIRKFELTASEERALREIWPTAQNNVEVALHVFGGNSAACLAKVRAGAAMLGLPNMALDRMRVGVAKAMEHRGRVPKLAATDGEMFGAPAGTRLFRDATREDVERWFGPAPELRPIDLGRVV